MSEPEPKVAAWENVVLRLIAIYKLSKATIVIVAAVGLRQFINRDVNQFLNDYILEHNYDPENHLVHVVTTWVDHHAPYFDSHHIRFYSYVLFFCAALFIAEGIGLYLRKHWAEYLVVISTGLLLPVEFYEFWGRISGWKLGVILGNLLIVAYLIHRLILDAKFKAERARERELAAAKAKEPASKPQAVSKVTS
jgi:uncharacterized membrane protein (DUF2068 family)